MAPSQVSRIKYIAFYNDNSFNSEENRITFLSINNKVDYICSVLNRCGFDVEIVSPCWTKADKGYYRGRVFALSEEVRLRIFASFGSRNFYINKIKRYYSALQLLIYLLFSTKKHEQIIVYHSLALMAPIKILKFIKKTKVILEVEEIFSHVMKYRAGLSSELQYIKLMDQYILVSDLLKNILTDKPSAVLYGCYQTMELTHGDKKADKVHVVYAGLIDDLKGGAKKAVFSMKHLPAQYYLHILGFGDSKSILELIKEIEIINRHKGAERCFFHGTMTGEEYHQFLSRCDIGVNPQNLGEYMDTAFPSKVLTYLSHNLKVVSTKIESIMTSKFAPYIIFADETPESVASAIITAKNQEEYSACQLLSKLNEEFYTDLRSLVK